MMPCRILLADDHDTYRKTIIRLLEHRGYQADGASCGDEVLALAVDHAFDLFVLDYKMPGNEGLILVEQLKALQPDVPVIILTGFASLPSAMTAVRLQLFDYIQKGEMPEHLLSRTDEAIQHTQLEKRLRESEAKYRLLAENIQDLITVFAVDGRVTYASPSIQMILGYTPDQFCGTDVGKLIHPDDRPGLEGAIARLLETGMASDYEARFQNSSGEYVWLSTSAKLLHNVSGEPQELVCSSRDITGRKRAEERIHLLAQHLETVREDERTHLSRELHDDIGQILTALKIDLVVVKDGCTCPAGVKNKMTDMQHLLSDGICSVHSLCRRLRPGALDDLGLGEALLGLADDWKQRNAVECHLFSDIDDESLSDEIKTAVFRFVQEALTNISRHAFASSVEINLVADEQILHIAIADNGRGMEDGAESKPSAFGLLGMRERFEALGGILYIQSEAGKGTRIEGTIPLARNG